MPKRKTDKQKAALYIRVSTHWQVDRDSLPVQRKELINYCQYALGINEYEVFEDAGYSGKNTERPAYKKMLERIRDGEFSHLLVWKLDRISRNLLDFAAMYDELKRLGVIFVSKNEQFDTGSAMGEAMLKIILVFAELERKVTSERVTSVMYSRAASGSWNGGKIPYGYDYDKATKTFRINSLEAVIVKMMYDLYEEKHSLLAVAKTLNDRGISSRSGKPWNPTTVSIILKNPFYTGAYRYNYREEGVRQRVKDESDWIIVENHHPAIIETERWQNICEVLSSQNRNEQTRKTYERRNTHIFAGLLECGCCGSTMSATIDRQRADGWRPSIYACTRKRRFDDCQNKYISDATLGPFVLNYISNILRAQRSFGKSTSLSTLEKKLLRGPLFKDIEHIEGLETLYDMLKQQPEQQVVFTSKAVHNITAKPTAEEKELLLIEQSRNERALERLKNLYLYSDSGMSETEFIIEQKSITDALNKINKRLKEINRKNSKNRLIQDDEFTTMASYYLMTQKLLANREVNFKKLIRQLDKKIIKEFINSTCQNFCIFQGKIQSIRFKNGMEHKFLYRENQ